MKLEDIADVLYIRWFLKKRAVYKEIKQINIKFSI